MRTHPDSPSDYGSTITQLGTDLVASLIERTITLAPDSFSIRSAVERFRESRSPWDATELANKLADYDPGRAAVMELVLEIDLEAEACAGIPLPNKVRKDVNDGR